MVGGVAEQDKQAQVKGEVRFIQLIQVPDQSQATDTHAVTTTDKNQIQLIQVPDQSQATDTHAVTTTDKNQTPPTFCHNL